MNNSNSREFNTLIWQVRVGQSGWAVWATTLSLPATCTVRNIPAESQMADIDRALRPHESGHTYDLKGNVTSDTNAELKAERITVA